MFRSIIPHTATDVTGASARRKRMLLLVKLLVTATAFAALLRLIDRDAFLTRLRQIDFGLVALVVVAAVIQVLLVAARWRLVIVRLGGGPAPGLRHITLITYAGQFFGQVLPFFVGDGLRTWLLTIEGIRLRLALRGVLTDRAIAVLVLVLLAVPPLLFAPTLRTDQTVFQLLSIMTAIMLGGAALVLVFSPLLTRFMHTWPLINVLAEVIADIRALLLLPTGLLVVGMAFAIHGISIAGVFLLGRSIGLPLALLDCLALVPPMLLVAMLPVAIGGWGVREAVVVVLLGTVGVAPDAALLLSLSFGAVLTVAALPGFAAWLILARRINGA